MEIRKHLRFCRYFFRDIERRKESIRTPYEEMRTLCEVMKFDLLNYCYYYFYERERKQFRANMFYLRR